MTNLKCFIVNLTLIISVSNWVIAQDQKPPCHCTTYIRYALTARDIVNEIIKPALSKKEIKFFISTRMALGFEITIDAPEKRIDKIDIYQILYLKNVKNKRIRNKTINKILKALKTKLRVEKIIMVSTTKCECVKVKTINIPLSLSLIFDKMIN